jgi:hypothetical protein
LFAELVLLSLSAAAPVTVAVPGLSVTDMPAGRGTAIVDYLAERLSAGGGLRVTTPTEIQAILGQERQRQLFGCADDHACLVELSGALGAEVLVVGSVARVGSELIATLKCVNATNGTVRGSWSTRAKSEEELLDFVDGTAKNIRALLLGSAPELPSSSRSPLRFVPAIAGGVAVVAAVVLFSFAFSQQQRLVNGDPGIRSADVALSVGRTGRAFELGSYVTGGIGAALLAGGLVLAFAGSF